jgi:hypothetical protein
LRVQDTISPLPRHLLLANHLMCYISKGFQLLQMPCNPNTRNLLHVTKFSPFLFLQIIVLEDTAEYIGYAPKNETKAQDRRPFDLLVRLFVWLWRTFQ